MTRDNACENWLGRDNLALAKVEPVQGNTQRVPDIALNAVNNAQWEMEGLR